ncbi:MAG TPA: sigma 54-interacting transcriptional regulator [Vicinamibacterales bacterium]|nr:sigma 54-interacting transcriptional regulator [Vicinamibacterales bacterium]
MDLGTETATISLGAIGGDIVTASDQMRQLLAYAGRVATGDAKVLITGESGVGKDVIARYVHAHSNRRRREYVAVNCAGMTESLLESELFGHVKGSFTGAYRDKRGKLQLAHDGTLFLDELAEMTPRMQGMLLRFLENGEIQAVGADAAAMRVNVRVIAATNRNLPEMVAAGSFREDLLYRLRVVHLQVPPLRERPEDVRPLGAHFLSKLQRQAMLTDEAWAVLEKYHWPGNVRELHNVIEQVSWLTPPGEPVTADLLPTMVRGGGAIVTPARERRRRLSDELFRMITEESYTFWEPIHRMFLARDLTRRDIRELVYRGLRETRGSYRALVTLFNLPESDYKKFMNFLGTHGCRPESRDVRNPPAASEAFRSPLVPPIAGPEPRSPRAPAPRSDRAAS